MAISTVEDNSVGFVTQPFAIAIEDTVGVLMSAHNVLQWSDKTTKIYKCKLGGDQMKKKLMCTTC